MATFKQEILPGEPIILSTLSEDYDIERDFPRSGAGIQQLLEAASEPMFLIVHAKFDIDVGNLMIGADRTSRGEQALYHHPKLREVIYVTASDLIKAAAPGLNSEIYGFLNMTVFETVEEALAYVRAKC